MVDDELAGGRLGLGSSPMMARRHRGGVPSSSRGGWHRRPVEPGSCRTRSRPPVDVAAGRSRPVGAAHRGGGELLIHCGRDTTPHRRDAVGRDPTQGRASEGEPRSRSRTLRCESRGARRAGAGRARAGRWPGCRYESRPRPRRTCRRAGAAGAARAVPGCVRDVHQSAHRADGPTSRCAAISSRRQGVRPVRSASFVMRATRRRCEQ